MNIVVKFLFQLLELEILRSHSYLLRQETEKNREILSTLENVGEMLIREGNVDKEDLEFISQPLVNNEDYRKSMNQDYLKAKEEKRNKDK